MSPSPVRTGQPGQDSPKWMSGEQSGCGRKLPPDELRDVLAVVDRLAGRPHASAFWSDCSITPMADETFMMQTVDIVLPLSIDPETWGRIVALHCLSDLYAAGGDPLTALTIYEVAPLWVRKGWHLAAYEGAVHELRQAGVSVVGGHTLRSHTTKLGFALVGQCRTSPRSRLNVRPGDHVIMTKPVGGGILLAEAVTASEPMEALAPGVIQWMLQSSSEADQAARSCRVTSATDVSGFGLIGSLLEIASASSVDIEVKFSDVPKHEGWARLAESGVIATLAERMMLYSEGRVEWTALRQHERLLLCDPQVNGGLLVAAAPEVATKYVQAMADRGHEAWVIGEVTGESASPLVRVD